MSDRQSQLAVLTDGLPEAAQTVRLNASLKGAVEWVSRHATSWELRGFGAIVGGLVVFSPLIDGGTTQLPVLMMRLVLMTSVAVWLIGRMKEGELFLPQARLDACVAGFVWWAALSLLWAPYKNASLQWVLSILFYAALFVIVTQGIRSQAQVLTQVVVVSATGVFEGLWGLAQYVLSDEMRARGTFFNPNFFSAYEAVVFVLSLGVLLFTKRDTLSVLFRIWLWSAAAISLAAVVTAQSRGASAALVGAVLVLTISRYGKKALAVVSLCVLVGLLVPNPLQHRIVQVAAEDPYAYTRLDIWKSALVRLADQPLGIGVGMFKQGSFQERFPVEGHIVRYRKRPESAHNEYLQIGVELGVVGLGLLLCGIGLWAAEVRYLLYKSGDRIDQGLVMGLAASTLVLLLHSGVDSSLHEPSLVILILLLGGLVHNLYLRVRPEAVIWRRIGFLYHPLRAASVIMGALVIAALCAQSALAWYAHQEGKRHAAQRDLEGALTWYTRAANIDPGTTGYHDSIARTAVQLYSESGAFDWLVRAAEEEAIARQLNPVDARFAYRAGTVYRMMSSQALTNIQRAQLVANASEAYNEAIRLDPYAPVAYFELAQLRLANGRVEDAIALLTTATTHEPNFLPGRVLLAELSLQLGIPGDYARELAAVTAIRTHFSQQVRDEVERQFIDVDLYPLGRAIALGAQS